MTRPAEIRIVPTDPSVPCKIENCTFIGEMPTLHFDTTGGGKFEICGNTFHLTDMPILKDAG